LFVSLLKQLDTLEPYFNVVVLAYGGKPLYGKIIGMNARMYTAIDMFYLALAIVHFIEATKLALGKTRRSIDLDNKADAPKTIGESPIVELLHVRQTYARF